MNNNLLISILCPSYNHEKYVGFFIDSLLAQTYENWELIIVDDCSTDNNVGIIKSYNDSRIILVEQEFNQGPGAALNTAFLKSKGDIIIDCASDDMLRNDYFNFLIKVFSTTSIELVYSSLQIIDKNNKKQTPIIYKAKNKVELLHDLFYDGNILPSPGMSATRNLYNKIIPMDISLIQHQDYQWHVNLLIHAHDVCVSQESFVLYRKDFFGKSLSSFSLGEYNRMRLEIPRVMDSFLVITSMELIYDFTKSSICSQLSSCCIPFILAYEALKSSNYDKKIWAYGVMCTIFNNCKIRNEIYSKIGFDFKYFMFIKQY